MNASQHKRRACASLAFAGIFFVGAVTQSDTLPLIQSMQVVARCPAISLQMLRLFCRAQTQAMQPVL
jgi:hypothetical protein